MSEQLVLDLFAGRDLQCWQADDLLAWSVRIGTFETCDECAGDPDSLCRFHMSKRNGTCRDAIKSVDVVPPVVIYTQENSKGEVRLRMSPFDIGDWNRGCPGCCSNMPEFVERHVMKHTGDSFADDDNALDDDE